MLLRRFVAASVLLIIGCAPATAQDPASTAPEIQSILNNLKIHFEDSKNDDARVFTFKLNGQTVVLAEGKSDLRLSSTSGHASVDQVNLWNANHRFSRAYVSSDGMAHLEADLDVSDGVSPKMIEAFITNFGSSARLFSTEVANAPSALDESKGTPKTRIGMPYGDFDILINPKEWQQAETRGGVLVFRQLGGDGYAMVITEPGMAANGLTGLKSAILANIKKNIPDIKVTLDDKRTVNGHSVLVLGLEGSVRGNYVQYLTNSYSGPSGTIQILTYTSKDAFEKNKSVFADFLNGLEINESGDSALAATNKSGRLALAPVKAVIEFEPSKWKLQNTQVGRYLLVHQSGELFAQVICETISLALDTLPDIGLANMKREAPDADVKFTGKLVVNGNNLIQTNVDATVRGTPLSYQNYYYSGKAGTIQIMTWTKQDIKSKYDKEVTEFLNGFRVLE